MKKQHYQLLSLLLFGGYALAAMAQKEAYSSRPDITSEAIAPKKQSTPEDREVFRAIQRMTAMSLATAQDSSVFFLGRDAEFHFDVARLMIERGIGFRGNVHLLNLSREIAHDASQSKIVLEYLIQNQIVDLLREGKTVTFIDTGWRGLSMSRVISLLKQYFQDRGWNSEELRKGGLIQIQFAHTLGGNEIPPSRVFIYSLNPNAIHVDPYIRHFAVRNTLRGYENNSPHFTGPASTLALVDGKIEALSEQNKNKTDALDFMAKLKYFAIAELEAFMMEFQWWKTFDDLQMKVIFGADTEAAKGNLVKFLNEGIESPFMVTGATEEQSKALGEARVRDAIDYLVMRRGWEIGTKVKGIKSLMRSQLHSSLATTEFAPNRKRIVTESTAALEDLFTQIRDLVHSNQIDSKKVSELTTIFKKAASIINKEKGLASRFQLELLSLLKIDNQAISRVVVKELSKKKYSLDSEVVSELILGTTDSTAAIAQRHFDLFSAIPTLDRGWVAALGGHLAENRFDSNTPLKKQIIEYFLSLITDFLEAEEKGAKGKTQAAAAKDKKKLVEKQLERLKTLEASSPAANLTLRVLLAITLSHYPLASEDQTYFDALNLTMDYAKAIMFSDLPRYRRYEILSQMNYRPRDLKTLEVFEGFFYCPEMGSGSEWIAAAKIAKTDLEKKVNSDFNRVQISRLISVIKFDKSNDESALEKFDVFDSCVALAQFLSEEQAAKQVAAAERVSSAILNGTFTYSNNSIYLFLKILDYPADELAKLLFFVRFGNCLLKLPPHPSQRDALVRWFQVMQASEAQMVLLKEKGIEVSSLRSHRFNDNPSMNSVQKEALRLAFIHPEQNNDAREAFKKVLNEISKWETAELRTAAIVYLLSPKPIHSLWRYFKFLKEVPLEETELNDLIALWEQSPFKTAYQTETTEAIFYLKSLKRCPDYLTAAAQPLKTSSE